MGKTVYSRNHQGYIIFYWVAKSPGRDLRVHYKNTYEKERRCTDRAHGRIGPYLSSQAHIQIYGHWESYRSEERW